MPRRPGLAPRALQPEMPGEESTVPHLARFLRRPAALADDLLGGLIGQIEKLNLDRADGFDHVAIAVARLKIDDNAIVTRFSIEVISAAQVIKHNTGDRTDEIQAALVRKRLQDLDL